MCGVKWGKAAAEKLSKAEITFHVTAEVQRVEEEDIPYFLEQQLHFIAIGRRSA